MTSWNPWYWFVNTTVARGEQRARRAYEVEEEQSKILTTIVKLGAELNECETDAARDECQLIIKAMNVLSEQLTAEVENL